MTSDDLAARGVRVKALIWLDVDHVYPDGSGRKLSMANGLLGLRYGIYETPQEGLHVVGPDGFAIYNMPSVQAAKAAAQADYEARILAALEATPAALAASPEVQAMIREAEARGQSEERAAIGRLLDQIDIYKRRIAELEARDGIIIVRGKKTT